ncbi:MAG: hypothetical protein C0446_11490 [Chitinophaga sp.]|nr:hypothetical protein [Chitinophaga sp.]
MLLIKKFNSKVTALCIFTVAVFFVSCDKNEATKIEDINKNFSVENYSKKMMIDTSFVKLVKKYSSSLYEVNSLVKVDPSSTNGFSTSNLIQIEKSTDNMSMAIANFVIERKSFFLLTENNRNQVLHYIQTAIKSTDFRIENPELVAPLLKVNKELNNQIELHKNVREITSNSLNSPANIKAKEITTNEFIGCAISALSSALGSYGNAIGDIRYLITQGWSGAALFDAALSIIKHASPWIKVASVALGFGGCIWGVAD